MSVSRETVAPAPALAGELFGPRLDTIKHFAQILAGDGVTRGVIGPREVVRLWDRHILNCAVVASVVPEGSQVADIGSGAGLPGIVWAVQRSDIAVTLVEPLERRIRFLTEVASELDLGHVSIVRGRAENVDRSFDIVAARALARMDKLSRITMPLVAEGGLLLALKGQAAQDELDSSRKLLKQLGATSAQLRHYGDLEVPTRVVEVRK